MFPSLRTALTPFLGEAVTLTTSDRRPPFHGTLYAVTSRGYVIQGPHYREWFAYQDLMSGADTLSGPAALVLSRILRTARSRSARSA